MVLQRMLKLEKGRIVGNLLEFSDTSDEEVGATSTTPQQSKGLMSRIKNMTVKKNEMLFKSNFIEESRTISVYMGLLRNVFDDVYMMIKTGRIVKKDRTPPPPESPIAAVNAWEKVTGALQALKANLHGNYKDKNEDRVEAMCRLTTNLANVENDVLRRATMAGEAGSVFASATTERLRLATFEKNVFVYLRKTNERRRKVQRAQILLDLRVQGRKYKIAIDKLDHECFEMCKFTAYLNNQIPVHFDSLLNVILPTLYDVHQKRLECLEQYLSSAQ